MELSLLIKFNVISIVYAIDYSISLLSLNGIKGSFQKKKQYKKWIWHFFLRYPPSLAKNEKYKNENWPTVKTPSLPKEIVNQMTNFIILFDILDDSKMKLHLYKATKVCFRSD